MTSRLSWPQGWGGACLFVLGAWSAFSSQAVAAVPHFGGPDASGYVFRDSTEQGGPAFAWVASTALAAQSTFGNDSHQATALPFAFPFYGGSYSSLEVDSNGYLHFTSEASQNAPEPLPSSFATPGIYPWWQDWNPTALGVVYWGTSGSNFVVSWDAIPLNGSSGLYSFQAILRPDGGVVFQYNIVSAADYADYGAGATIGVEKGAGGSYLEYYGGEGAGPLTTGLAIEFRPCATVDGDVDGTAECAGDCQDSRADVHPGAVDEYGNGIDEDCDGADGVNSQPGDDDTAADDDTEPGCSDKETICDDGLDNDCDGHVDDFDGHCAQACGWKPASQEGPAGEEVAAASVLLAFGAFRRWKRSGSRS